MSIGGWKGSTRQRGQLHRADGSAFQLKQIAVTVRSKLQNDCRELQARCIAGTACEVASDCSPSPVEGLSDFFQRVGIVADAAAARCVVHDRPQFQRLGQSGGYSRHGLRGRMGVHRILESSSYAIGPEFFNGAWDVPPE